MGVAVETKKKSLTISREIWVVRLFCIYFKFSIAAMARLMRCHSLVVGLVFARFVRREVRTCLLNSLSRAARFTMSCPIDGAMFTLR